MGRNTVALGQASRTRIENDEISTDHWHLTAIGQAAATVLASRGWSRVATMRNLKRTGSLEQALKEAGLQSSVELEQLDVTSGASIQAAVESILARTGNKLDAVVHNAGVAAAGAFEDVPESELRRVMETGPRLSPMSLSRLVSRSFL
ncbi:MAG TPA: SDR family NAD(P)-dependent oxidoreductase [Methyloceanibacter sp.]|nr:SDR family NAD(P)-dependent oxidoreductase [Methyloceanibacter sp.]